MPCPYLENFYPTGYVNTNMLVTLAFSGIFSVFSFLTLAIYLVIPSKRKYPHTIVTSLSLSFSLVLFGQWVVTYVGYERTICNNQYDAVSGAILVVPSKKRCSSSLP